MFWLFIFMASMSGIGLVGTILLLNLPLVLQLDASSSMQLYRQLYFWPWGVIALVSAIIATVVAVKDERDFRKWRKKREETL